MVTSELVARARAGDPLAFEEIVWATNRQAYTLALRLVRDRQEAEDVTQDAYLRALRGLGGFREDASFETWLYRIVANTAITHLRKRGRFGLLLDEAEDNEGAGPSSGAGSATSPEEAVIEVEALARALDALPEAQRVPVILKDVYGFSCLEIGERMGLSEGAVKVRLHRARRRLRDALSAEGPDDV
jgi:RNA polymerase sigma-70 factor, ECF subfamily